MFWRAIAVPGLAVGLGDEETLPLPHPIRKHKKGKDKNRKPGPEYFIVNFLGRG